MTKRGPVARRSQNSSSHQSIEAPDPMIRRIAGSVRSPNVSAQRLTPFASTIWTLARPIGVRDLAGQIEPGLEPRGEGGDELSGTLDVLQRDELGRRMD